MFRISKFLKLGCGRRFSSGPANSLEHLKHRTLIRVSGNEVAQFLQGLITNDIEHLNNGPSCMYSMVLNTKGRVLCDSIIYRTDENNTYFMECDKEIAPMLQKHLKIYKVRRKIAIDDLEDKLHVHVAFNVTSTEIKNPLEAKTSEVEESKTAKKINNDVFVYRDPRIASLGYRILSATLDIKDATASLVNVDSDMNNHVLSYRKFRYRLGVGEGIVDLPPGECFPLEANCDYLHGVSFHKGCYIGQELTARTHHTGVIRKRLMPIVFSTVPTVFPEDNKILTDKTNLGKFRGLVDDVGLGLLRIAQAIEIQNIPIGNGVGHTVKPNWWPIEAPKEKMTAQKT